MLCRGVGIRVPQLKLLSTVVRTEPVAEPVPYSIVAPGFSLRPRLDGGYTMSSGLTTIFDVVPDVLRYFREFRPLMKERKKFGVSVRFGGRFFTELAQGFSGARSFTKVRQTEPKPYVPDISNSIRNAVAAIPALGKLEVAESWAGLFDVSPDGMPIISAVDGAPGLILSTGYSGHGFGLGPAGGEMTADLVLGRTPKFASSPFRLSRFA